MGIIKYRNSANEPWIEIPALQGSKGDTGAPGKDSDVSLEYLNNNFSNALIGNASGSTIEIEDISPIEHEVKVVADGATTVTKYGKNLIPYPYHETTKTISGITFADNGDRGIAISGTATDSCYFILARDMELGDTINAVGLEQATNGDYSVSKRLHYNSGNKILSLHVTAGETVNEVLYPTVEIGETINTQSFEVSDGTASIPSLYPYMTLVADAGTIQCEYKRDVNKALAATVDYVDKAVDDALASIGIAEEGEY